MSKTLEEARVFVVDTYGYKDGPGNVLWDALKRLQKLEKAIERHEEIHPGGPISERDLTLWDVLKED